ncbi:Substrate-specific component FolT of folate ECF transporter [Streptococcus sp. DD13]|nr:Substrate-specific component FolT of folate ECF transporter [Streptococcus sp. DD13]
MLIALSIVIKRLGTITIIPGLLKVSFAFVANTLIGMVGGPFWGFVGLAAGDVIGMALSGGMGQFIIWFTLLEAVQGALYGYFYYGNELDAKEPKSWLRVTLATLAIMLLGTFIVTPILNWIYNGVPILAQYASGRIFKVFEIPVRVLVTMALIPPLQKIPEVRRLMGLTRKK